MSLEKKLKEIKNRLPSNVKLVAVSKTKPIEDIKVAYNAGQRVFGENKAQELFEKQPLLPEDIEWHFVGHLQSNKVKYIAPYVSLVHSVDSVKLLAEVNKHAYKNKRTIDCLLQFHIATEENKFGLNLKEALSIFRSEFFTTLNNIRVVGVMGMATFTDDMDIVREEFKHLKECFDAIKEEFYTDDNSFCEVSMGMSQDYAVAIEEGSTLVRIGSSIFGAREPKAE